MMTLRRIVRRWPAAPILLGVALTLAWLGSIIVVRSARDANYLTRRKSCDMVYIKLKIL